MWRRVSWLKARINATYPEYKRCIHQWCWRAQKIRATCWRHW